MSGGPTGLEVHSLKFDCFNCILLTSSANGLSFADASDVNFHGGQISGVETPSGSALRAVDTSSFYGTSISTGSALTYSVNISNNATLCFVRSVIKPCLGCTNATGVQVAAGSTAHFVGSDVRGNGTGVALNNSGTAYADGRYSVQRGFSGTRPNGLDA